MLHLLLKTFLLQFLFIQGEFINDPTLKPASNFSADDDAETIRNEMLKSDKDINRDKISRIFFHCTYEQRAQIENSYDTKFCGNKEENKCTFHSALKDISIVSMEDLYVDALVSPVGLLAETIQASIGCDGGEVGAIEEIVCANDKAMKDSINEYYINNYSTTVEEDLKTFRQEDTDYQNVMLKYCWKGFNQDKKITAQDVENEAQALQKIDAKADKEGFKQKLIELLDKTSEPALKQIFQKYRKEDYGIGDAVRDAFDVDRVRRAYGYLVRYLEDTCRFYADQLHETVGADLQFIIRVSKINRLILTRCERDLMCIFNKYKDLHGKTFTNHLDTLFVKKGVFYSGIPQTRYVESIRYLCGKP